MSMEVYPRVCGGNPPSTSVKMGRSGLSPRVRGKLTWRRARAARTRSIPACAGETAHGRPGAATAEVYPRVCGGNGVAAYITDCGHGLSPRVRGKPNPDLAGEYNTRSIPACAGETRLPAPGYDLARVYPRVCGGNHRKKACRIGKDGLSPRVRGKRKPRAMC